MLGIGASLLTAAGFQSQAPPTFRSGVTLVELDVSVLDKNRRPIRGLQASHFTVLEDGREQKVTAFVAIDTPSAPAPTAPWIQDVVPDVQSNDIAAQADSRLFVVLIDDALIPFDPAAIQSAKQIARRVIEQTAPRDRVAVVFSAGSRGTQNFTNDRALLLAAVETLNPSYAAYTYGWNTARQPDPPGVPTVAQPYGPVSDPDSTYRFASLRTLRSVAESLVGAPQRRKVLVHISPGITVDPASASSPQRGSVMNRMTLKEENAALFREMPSLFRQMQHANVNIYTVDPCGLGGLTAYIGGILQQLPALRVSGGPATPQSNFDWLAPTPPPPSPAFLARHVSGLSREFARTAAENTGGFALVDTNDFETGLAQMFAENESYYVLGYPAPSRNRAGSEHRLQVKVNRPDAIVRVRTGYTMPAAAPEANAGAGARGKVMAGPVASGDLRLRAALAPLAGDSGPVLAVALDVELPLVKERTTEKFDLETAVFTPDGQRRGSKIREATIPVSAATGATPPHYELLFHHPLEPGRYEFRIAAARGSDRLAGSVFAHVEIPDFARAPLSLSGVMVEARPGPASGPRGEFTAIAPVVATARRDFQRSDVVAAVLRVYQMGAASVVPATVRVRIVNAIDKVVVDVNQPLGPDRFDLARRAADLGYAIPTSALEAGEYLLRFDVTAGAHTAQRAIRFSIR